MERITRSFTFLLGLLVLLFVALVPSVTEAQTYLSSGFCSPTVGRINSNTNWLFAGSEYYSGQYHIGSDYGSAYSAGKGQPVYAVAPGKVTYNYTDRAVDQAWIWIRFDLSDGSQFCAVYGHIQSAPPVGTMVAIGQQVGVVGEWPGNSSNSHLHFGIRPAGELNSGWGKGSLPSGWNGDKSTLDVRGFVAPYDFLMNHHPKGYSAAPDKPNLLSPAWDDFGTRMSSGRAMNLVAECLGGWEPDSWDYWIENSSGQRIWESGWFNSGRHAEVYSPVLWSGTYWWSCRARRAGQEGPSADGRPFHINFIPDQPSKNWPINDVWVNSKNPTLSWNDPGDGDNWPNPGDGWPNKYRDYHVKIRKEDGTGIGDTGWGYTSTSWAPNTTEDGRYYWTVAAGDGAEDVGFGPEASFRVDTTPPNLTSTSTDASAITSANSIQFTVVASDAGSGVRNLAFSVDGSSTYSISGNSTTWTWDTSQISGTHFVDVYAVDNVGNTCSAKRFSFTIDHTNPSITYVVNPTKPDGINNWYRVSPTLTLVGTAPSGISAIWYQLGGGEWTQYTAPLSITQRGTFDVSFYAISSAGLKSATTTIPLKIDSTPPTLPLLVDEGMVTTSQTRLSLLTNTIDPESGVYALQYMVGKAPNDASYRALTTVYPKYSDYLVIDGLSLPIGATVYVTLRPINGAGSTTALVSTDGILIDPFNQAMNVNSFVTSAAGCYSYHPAVFLSGTLGEPFANTSGFQSATGSGMLEGGYTSCGLTVMVTSYVRLGDFVGKPTTQPITLTVRQSGSSQLVNQVLCLFQPSGVLYADIGYLGTFDFTVKAAHWRSATVKNNVITKSGMAFANTALINGDVNGDDKIDAVDTALVDAAMGSKAGDANWNANADLNGDGVVNSLDRAIVVKNQGL